MLGGASGESGCAAAAGAGTTRGSTEIRSGEAACTGGRAESTITAPSSVAGASGSGIARGETSTMRLRGEGSEGRGATGGDGRPVAGDGGPETAAGVSDTEFCRLRTARGEMGVGARAMGGGRGDGVVAAAAAAATSAAVDTAASATTSVAAGSAAPLSTATTRGGVEGTSGGVSTCAGASAGTGFTVSGGGEAVWTSRGATPGGGGG